MCGNDVYSKGLYSKGLYSKGLFSNGLFSKGKAENRRCLRGNLNYAMMRDVQRDSCCMFYDVRKMQMRIHTNENECMRMYAG